MKIIFALLLLAACASKNPKDHFDDLTKADATKIKTTDDTAELSKQATPLVFKKSLRTKLASEDPVIYLDTLHALRSHYKVFEFKPQSKEVILDIRSYPGKDLGFGQIGQIIPLVQVFHEKGKVTKAQVESLYSGYDRSFVDGEFLRQVYKIKSADPSKTYYALIAAATDKTGMPLRSMQMYGNPYVSSLPVVVSPVGAFSIQQSDQFESPPKVKK